VIGLAQLMVVLDLTVMNIALPSAQRALHFSTADRQWVVTAYTLAFGSLLLPGGRLADLLGRKITFLTGLAGFAGAGGAVGLLLGGALTEYLSWRWTLYVNLLFAGVAFTGGALLLKGQSSRVKPRLDVPGALLVSSGVFCLVHGLSNAATHSWRMTGCQPD
jgi:MFS family permease